MINDLVDIVASTAKKVSGVINKSDSFLDINRNKKKKAYSGQSIKARTKDLIMQFPLLVSESVSIESVEKINDFLDKEYCQLVKTVLINDLGELTDDVNNANQIISKFHTNINTNSVFESFDNLIKNKNNKTSVDAKLYNEHLNSLITLEEKVNMNSLNETTYPMGIHEKYNINSVLNEIKVDLVKNKDKTIDKVNISKTGKVEKEIKGLSFNKKYIERNSEFLTDEYKSANLDDMYVKHSDGTLAFDTDGLPIVYNPFFIDGKTKKKVAEKRRFEAAKIGINTSNRFIKFDTLKNTDLIKESKFKSIKVHNNNNNDISDIGYIKNIDYGTTMASSADEIENNSKSISGEGKLDFYIPTPIGNIKIPAYGITRAAIKKNDDGSNSFGMAFKIGFNPNTAIRFAIGKQDALRLKSEFSMDSKNIASLLDPKSLERVNKAEPFWCYVPVQKRSQTELTSKNLRSSEQINVVFGVKVVNHLLKSDEIIENLNFESKASNPIFNFIRWTSGELSLFKDLILAKDENKRLAKITSKENNFWWYKLKRLSKMRNFKSRLPGINKCPAPITTLLISKDDIISLRQSKGIDLFKAKNAQEIINRLFFMSFIYVDESNEVFYVLDENEGDFRQITFNQIKSKEKGQMKDLAELVSQLSR